MSTQDDKIRSLQGYWAEEFEQCRNSKVYFAQNYVRIIDGHGNSRPFSDFELEEFRKIVDAEKSGKEGVIICRRTTRDQ